MWENIASNKWIIINDKFFIWAILKSDNNPTLPEEPKFSRKQNLVLLLKSLKEALSLKDLNKIRHTLRSDTPKSLLSNIMSPLLRERLTQIELKDIMKSKINMKSHYHLTIRMMKIIWKLIQWILKLQNSPKSKAFKQKTFNKNPNNLLTLSV